MGRSLFEKIWDNHLVHDLGDGFGLIFVDRQLLTELATPQFDQLEKRGLPLLLSRMHVCDLRPHGRNSARQRRSRHGTRQQLDARHAGEGGEVRLYPFRRR